MQAERILTEVLQASGLSRRELARRAATSSATIAAYEAGTVVPSLAVVDRIVTAAGFAARVELVPDALGEVARGEILVDLLGLAEQFPWGDPGPLEFPPLDAQTVR